MMNTHLKSKMRMATVLVGIAEELLLECSKDIGEMPIGGAKKFVYDALNSLTDTKYCFLEIYLWDKGFAGPKVQQLKSILRDAVDDNIDEIANIE